MDLFKRPSDDEDDLPQPLSDHDLLAWSAELALIPETDDFTLPSSPQPRRRRPLQAAPGPAERPRRTRPLVADPV